MIEQHESTPSRFTTDLKEYLKPSDQLNHQIGLQLINTRLWLDQLSNKYRTRISIDTVPPQEWEELFALHDCFWFMGIYAPSNASRQSAQKYADQYRYALPDLDPERDISASPFAVPEYSPNPSIAKSWDKWDTMLELLHANGKKAFIDFIPNHVALDHPWGDQHPDYFIQGNLEQKADHPKRYHTITAQDGRVYHLAHGKDPNFPEWSDTLQLNYANENVHTEMKNTLLHLVKHSDGVRCDMAMLLNSDTFLRTWGEHLTDEQRQYLSTANFWQNVIPEVKKAAQQTGKADFTFIAEAYWDEEQLGQHFDYIYEKKFYDHLRRMVNEGGNPQDLYNHVAYLLTAVRNGRPYKGVQFTENHDEERAVRTFGKDPSKAAAILASLIPDSILLLNQGQDEGRRVRPPMQINRLPQEDVDEEMKKFYTRLSQLKHSTLFQQGQYSMAQLAEANPQIMSVEINLPDNKMNAVVCVNFSNSFASCRVPAINASKEAEVYDLTGGFTVPNQDTIRQNGMYVGLIPWETQVIFYR